MCTTDELSQTMKYVILYILRLGNCDFVSSLEFRLFRLLVCIYELTLRISSDDPGITLQW